MTVPLPILVHGNEASLLKDKSKSTFYKVREIQILRSVTWYSKTDPKRNTLMKTGNTTYNINGKVTDNINH
jgi:hypothetical protein